MSTPPGPASPSSGTPLGVEQAAGLARLLAAVHDGGACRTRSELTALIGISRGTATSYAALVRALCLAEETIARIDPSTPRPRGRPTAVVGPHPAGPLVLAAGISHHGWRVTTVELGGRVHELEAARHDSKEPDDVLSIVNAAAHRAVDRFGRRVVSMALSVPGTVRDGRIAQAANLMWRDVDAAGRLGDLGLPLVLGNDATLAGVAESRRGAGRGVRVVLHLHVDRGIGGTLVVDRRPLTDAHGSGGEFGHMPFAAQVGERCRCGARRCWNLEFDLAGTIRRAHGPAATTPSRAEEVVSAARGGDREAGEVLRAAARALGMGAAALVNAHDPGVVTLSGLAPALLDYAPGELQASYVDGLMEFHRTSPPPIRASSLGADGPLLGAAEEAFDHLLSPAGIQQWARAHANPVG